MYPMTPVHLVVVVNGEHRAACQPHTTPPRTPIPQFVWQMTGEPAAVTCEMCKKTIYDRQKTETMDKQPRPVKP